MSVDKLLFVRRSSVGQLSLDVPIPFAAGSLSIGRRIRDINRQASTVCSHPPLNHEIQTLSAENCAASSSASRRTASSRATRPLSLRQACSTVV